MTVKDKGNKMLWFNVFGRIARLESKLEQIMANEADLEAALGAIKGDLETASADVSTLGTTIAATLDSLKAQIAAGTPVTQAQLDQLVTQAQGIDAAAKTLDAAVKAIPTA